MAARRSDLAQKMRSVIEASGMDQTTIAEKVGTTQATVSRWATASSSPDRKHWAAIRKVLGVDLASPAAVSSHVDVAALQAQVDRLELQAMDHAAQLVELAAEVKRLGGEPQQSAGGTQ